jgi:hypothetical protein
MGEYKMAPTDFIEHMMAVYKLFMPSFATIYEQDEIRGDNWTADILKDRIKGMVARGTLRVEESVRKKHAEKKAGANTSKATGCGVKKTMNSGKNMRWSSTGSHGMIPAAIAAPQHMARETRAMTSTPPIATDNPRAKVTAEARAAKAIRKADRATPRAKATDAAKAIAKAGRATGTAKATTATSIAVNTVSKTMATGSLGENCGAPPASGKWHAQ